VFGLHENADITSAQVRFLPVPCFTISSRNISLLLFFILLCKLVQDATNVMFSTVLALLPRTAAGKGKSREEIIGEMVLVFEITYLFHLDRLVCR
jgi:hypothetical protein